MKTESDRISDSSDVVEVEVMTFISGFQSLGPICIDLLSQFIACVNTLNQLCSLLPVFASHPIPSLSLSVVLDIT